MSPKTEPSIFVCQECRKSTYPHAVHIMIDGAMWRVPIQICHNDKCLVAAKAVLVFDKAEVDKITSKDATGDHNGPLVTKENL